MATEPMLMADPNKMAARKPAASVLPQNVKRPPKDFNGCKCPISKCVNNCCPCPRNGYPCTSKCKCKGCKNKLGVRGSDPIGDANTEPVRKGCKCTVSNCATKNCHCLRVCLLHARCTSMCKCENCSNLPGGRGSKPEEAVRLAELAMQVENEGSDPEVGEDAISSKVTELLMEIQNKGSDSNKLP